VEQDKKQDRESQVNSLVWCPAELILSIDTYSIDRKLTLWNIGTSTTARATKLSR